MILELVANNVSLDLYSDAAINYVLQVNDIANVKDRQASFSNSFSLPKTPKNVKFFEGLGITSDGSTIPYKKIDCTLKYDGFDFIIKGWFNVTDATNDYKVFIYSGIINFFKAIENRNIGELDLAEINHSKTLQNYVASQTNDTLNYAYMLANFNGKTHRDNGDINIDFINPFVKVSYLFNKIHEFANYAYDGSFLLSEDFTNFWLSYPKPIEIGDVEYYSENINIPFEFSNGNTDCESGSYLATFNNGGNDGILANASGTYLLHIDKSFGFNLPSTDDIHPTGELTVYYSINNGSLIEYTSDVFLSLNQNDIIKVFYQICSNWQGTHSVSINIKKTQNISFTEELKEMKMTDFLKDIYNLFGITPFNDDVEKTIIYKTTTERFDRQISEVQDWSKYFINQNNESYVFNDYSRRNWFVYKYNDKESNYYDYFIPIENENLKDSSTVFASFSYAPEFIKESFFVNSTITENLDVFKLYERESNEENGVITIKYKALSKRFFYARQRIIDNSAVIGSDIENQSQTITRIKVAEFKNLAMNFWVGKYYDDFRNIIENSRLINVDFNLPIVKLMQTNLDFMIYLEQLQQYYVVNKISVKENKQTADLIRVIPNE